MGVRLEVDSSWCKGCGICAAFCPKNILELQQEKIVVTDRDACLKCGICEGLCPDFAIYLVKEEEQENG